jgi:hypothetical protein
MLTPTKKAKLFAALKLYYKKYLQGHITELDESGTRLMVNEFLINVLGFAPIEEVKTEYMIKGTYADYVVQVKGVRQFLVEVKALSLVLSDKHLRQAINYGANEGIDWALLTNGRSFDFYRIIFGKPIDSRKVFSLNLSDATQLKNITDFMQYLHRDSVANKGLSMLWNKNCALDPCNVAGILYSPSVTNIIRRALNEKFKTRFIDEEIHASLNRIVVEKLALETIKPMKGGKPKVKPAKEKAVAPTLTILETPPGESLNAEC